MNPEIRSQNFENILYIENNECAPDWRHISEGLSWIGLCSKNECREANGYMSFNFGYGNFDFKRIYHKIKCIKCGSILKKLFYGFLNAKWKISGKTSSNESIELEGQAFNKFTHIKSLRKIDWGYLNIIVNDLLSL